MFTRLFGTAGGSGGSLKRAETRHRASEQELLHRHAGLQRDLALVQKEIRVHAQMKQRALLGAKIRRRYLLEQRIQQTGAQLEAVQKQIEALENTRLNKQMTDDARATQRALRPLTTDRAVSRAADAMADVDESLERVQELTDITSASMGLEPNFDVDAAVEAELEALEADAFGAQLPGLTHQPTAMPTAMRDTHAAAAASASESKVGFRSNFADAAVAEAAPPERNRGRRPPPPSAPPTAVAKGPSDEEVLAMALLS